MFRSYLVAAALVALLTSFALAQTPEPAKPDPAKPEPAKPEPAKPADAKPGPEKSDSAPKKESAPAAKPQSDKPPSPDELLRYKYAPGDVLHYQIKSELAVQQAAGDAVHHMSLSRDDIVSLRVAELDDKGFAHLQQRFVRLTAKGRFDGQEFFFDSKATPNRDARFGKLLNPLYERLAGGEVQLLVGPQGEISEVRGYAELVRDVIAGNPLAMQCAGGGTNNALRVTAEEQSVIFGNKVVKPGEKWEVPIDLEAPALGRVRGRRVYTLVGPDKVGSRPTLRINISTELALDLALDRDGTRLTGRLSTSDATGVAQFDKQAGRLVSLKVGYKLSGKLTTVIKDVTTEIDDDQSHTIAVELLDKLPQ